ncbi:hypothetical protein ACIQAL_16665 [Pseudomonas sp. NPDC088368]|uniref:hypothetical protein n=1 Tax=Pseudomonas sp. NPDC088368 TaxID=3364453 RepID=UPI00380114A6
MNEVVPRSEIKRHQLARIENPYFATLKVERALTQPSSVCGLPRLISECGIALGDCHREYHKRPILECTDRADWFLVADRPFKPLCDADFVKYKVCGFRALACSKFHMASARMYLTSGPGRWVTKDIEYDTATNALSFAANWLTSRGEEGRIFLAEGKDYANTFRTVVQEWLPLLVEHQHLKAQSMSRSYGEVRRIRQQYVEGEDHWQISGSSWHWRPVTMDIVYELRGE